MTRRLRTLGAVLLVIWFYACGGADGDDRLASLHSRSGSCAATPRPGIYYVEITEIAYESGNVTHRLLHRGTPETHLYEIPASGWRCIIGYQGGATASCRHASGVGVFIGTRDCRRQEVRVFSNEPNATAYRTWSVALGCDMEETESSGEPPQD